MLPDRRLLSPSDPRLSLLSPLSLTLCSRPREPDESSSSNAGGETAIKLARATDLLFRLPSGFAAPRAAPRRVVPFLGGNETAGNATRHLRPPPPFNLEKFQRVRISDALERTD